MFPFDDVIVIYGVWCQKHNVEIFIELTSASENMLLSTAHGTFNGIPMGLCWLIKNTRNERLFFFVNICHTISNQVWNHCVFRGFWWWFWNDYSKMNILMLALGFSSGDRKSSRNKASVSQIARFMGPTGPRWAPWWPMNFAIWVCYPKANSGCSAPPTPTPIPLTHRAWVERHLEQLCHRTHYDVIVMN